MYWLVGGIAAAFLLPPLLRKAAENPQVLRQGAEAIDVGREKAIEYGKRGAKAAATKARELYEARQANKQVQGTFKGLLR